MHEVSLGFKIRDYLSGEEINATTYEDLRQDIVKMMVEEKGYPKENIHSKYPIKFDIDGKEFVKNIDFVVFLDEKPLMVVIFCAGEIETYVREAVSLSRLIPDFPARFSLVTDTQSYILLSAKDGEIISKGSYENFPRWESIIKLTHTFSEFLVDKDKIEKEKRILYALSSISCECRDSCK